jgi:hypothetical protein
MTSSPNTNVTRESKPRDTPLSHEELLKLFSIVDPCRSGPRDKIQWRKHPSLEHDIYEELHISRTQAQNYLSRNKHLKRPLPTQSQSASVVTRSNSSKTQSMLNNDAADVNSNDNILEEEKCVTLTDSTENLQKEYDVHNEEITKLRINEVPVSSSILCVSVVKTPSSDEDSSEDESEDQSFLEQDRMLPSDATFSQKVPLIRRKLARDHIKQLEDDDSDALIKLIDYGFDREKAKLALETANDDFNVAVDTLLAEPVRDSIQEKCIVSEIDEESFFEYHIKKLGNADFFEVRQYFESLLLAEEERRKETILMYERELGKLQAAVIEAERRRYW